MSRPQPAESVVCLRLVSHDLEFVAETRPDAPHSTAAFLALLPWQTQLVHVRWSGEGVWIPLGERDFALPWENPTRYPAPGDVLFYPGGYSETEILLAYGACSFASKLGPIAGNHFMSLVEGREQLPELGRRCLWQGAQPLTITTHPTQGGSQ
ncbi:Protein of unknown function [Franzmannia pantelleriensis]|uniref:Cyclophilin-like superfamily protein n=1 Tax=Franzmannia pantelleriensis TaxID=48727 RepID=A0A1G9S1K5_9GAMM|nr:DUF3830 family protein [Halomonas pantelleriensis]SDM29438.1 Protein of unknown function [Halomonas pantelleriensis]